MFNAPASQCKVSLRRGQSRYYARWRISWLKPFFQHYVIGCGGILLTEFPPRCYQFYSVDYLGLALGRMVL